MNKSKKYKTILLLILILAFFLRIVGLNWEASDRYPSNFTFHPDEIVYLQSILKYFNPAKLDFRFPYVLYGPLLANIYYLTIRLASLFGYLNLKLPISGLIHNLPQTEYAKVLTLCSLVNLIFSLLSIYLIYRIGKLLYSEGAGLLCALLLTLNPEILLGSYYLKYGAQMIFWQLLTLFFCLHLLKTKEAKWYLRAGVAAGFGFTGMSKNLVLLAGVIFTHFLSEFNKFNLISLLRSKKLAYVLIAFLVALLLGAPQFTWLRQQRDAPNLKDLVTAARSFSAGRMPLSFSWKGELLSEQVLDWEILYVKASLPGIVSRIVPTTLAGTLRITLPLVFGCLFYFISLLGIVLFCLRRRKEDILLLFFLILWLMQLSLMGSWIVTVRYGDPLIPLYILFGAGFIHFLFTKINLKKGILPKLGKICLVLLTAYILVRGFVLSYALVDRLAYKNIRTEASEWIETHIERGAKVGTYLWLNWYHPSILNHHCWKDDGRFRFFFLGELGKGMKSWPEVEREGVDYFIISSVETEGVLRYPNFYNKESKILEKITQGKEYKLVKHFERKLKFFNLPLPLSYIPMEWKFSSPESISIYQRS